jgi:hypothetical protein
MAQTHSKKRSLGETLNTWTQIIAIFIAAVWGVYTFIFKEIMLPKSAPVNISINLQLKKIGTGAIKANLTAVEMKISATNPSTREIHLLPSAWIAQAMRIDGAEKDETNFADATANALRDPRNIYTVQRHAERKDSTIVAAGFLFADEGLRPNEAITRTIIFYVPRDEYDLINVTAKMPSGEDVSRIRLEWVLNKEEQDLDAAFYRVNENREGTPITAKDAYSDKRAKLEWTQANSQISLWP